MGQSLVKNYVHIVFSTKYRQPLITEEIEKELYNYMLEICRRLNCDPIIIGGFTDHIHILCKLSTRIPLMKLLEEVKAHSSKWIKTKGIEFANFYWQNGYGAFSVTPSDMDRLINYIKNQKQHHSKSTFQNEYRSILKKCDMPYDERYVWD